VLDVYLSSREVLAGLLLAWFWVLQYSSMCVGKPWCLICLNSLLDTCSFKKKTIGHLSLAYFCLNQYEAQIKEGRADATLLIASTCLPWPCRVNAEVAVRYFRDDSTSE
jgi:hypothetical protein